MHNEEKVEAAKKDAGGDEKLIIKFAWPYGSAGPSSLPGSINTPKHQDDPQRGAYGRPSIQDDIELRGA